MMCLPVAIAWRAKICATLIAPMMSWGRGLDGVGVGPEEVKSHAARIHHACLGRNVRGDRGSRDLQLLARRGRAAELASAATAESCPLNWRQSGVLWQLAVPHPRLCKPMLAATEILSTLGWQLIAWGQWVRDNVTIKVLDTRAGFCVSPGALRNYANRLIPKNSS